MKEHLAGLLMLAVGAAMIAAPVAAIAQEQPVAAETNPPGDIPDSQVFVEYRSPLGFILEVPEGWARTERTDGARFADKYDVVDISLADADKAPTAAGAATHEAADLAKSGRAIKIVKIKDVKLPSGPAVLISYTSNSDPNPVTNKQIRLENNRYLIFKPGKLATLDLSAPMGADNVDQWKLMSDAFSWN